jgi:hypothetical protein
MESIFWRDNRKVFIKNDLAVQGNSNVWNILGAKYSKQRSYKQGGGAPQIHLLRLKSSVERSSEKSALSFVPGSIMVGRKRRQGSAMNAAARRP